MPNQQFFEWFFNSDLFFSAKGSSSDEIWGFYDYFKDEKSRLITSARRYKKLAKLLDWGSPKSIMKIGPSTGTFLHAANQAGHTVRGCDVSNNFAQYALDNYDITIDQGRFEKMNYAPEQYDALLLLNVVENVPNLNEFFEAIQQSIKIGGHFIVNHVEMKNNMIERFQKDKYFIYRPPICYAFEGDTLDKLMAKHGFQFKTKIRDVRYLHLEKITTLLRWKWALKLSKLLGISRLHFPIWAYPSWISVYTRVE
ncbi:hypothetical protein BST96_06940 [Oceanicoccus sagamiensis]|uniref:Methyltransferase type 11 domain-containing protein n=2 Tax=Oceanicoccus sagamiensis TaxID=716816 RepID=A0A1X9N9L6_9GAMM|nr:hypothetical protein BST96_06940 [Oceanicoccus sagamiensis]